MPSYVPLKEPKHSVHHIFSRHFALWNLIKKFFHISFFSHIPKHTVCKFCCCVYESKQNTWLAWDHGSCCLIKCIYLNLSRQSNIIVYIYIKSHSPTSFLPLWLLQVKATIPNKTLHYLERNYRFLWVWTLLETFGMREVNTSAKYTKKGTSRVSIFQHRNTFRTCCNFEAA